MTETYFWNITVSYATPVKCESFNLNTSAVVTTQHVIHQDEGRNSIRPNKAYYYEHLIKLNI